MWLLPLDSGILTPMDVAEGFRLWEDEDFIYLTWHDETVATWFAAGVTKESVQEEIIKCFARV